MAKTNLMQLIKVYKDFPKAGIDFIDLNPVISQPAVMNELIEWMKGQIAEIHPDKIIAVESRGFVYGAMLAYVCQIPLVLARKPGKLPGQVLEAIYQKEYGKDSLEIQAASIEKGDKIVVVDDVLATGGTAKAVDSLVSSACAEVAKFLFVAELKNLDGRSLLGASRVASFEMWE